MRASLLAKGRWPRLRSMGASRPCASLSTSRRRRHPHGPRFPVPPALSSGPFPVSSKLTSRCVSRLLPVPRLHCSRLPRALPLTPPRMGGWTGLRGSTSSECVGMGATVFAAGERSDGTRAGGALRALTVQARAPSPDPRTRAQRRKPLFETLRTVHRHALRLRRLLACRASTHGAAGPPPGPPEEARDCTSSGLNRDRFYCEIFENY